MQVHHWFSTTVFHEALPLEQAQLEALEAAARAVVAESRGSHGTLKNGGASSYRHEPQILARPAFADLRALIIEELQTVIEALGCPLGSGELAIANSWANLYPPGSFVSVHDHGGAVLSGALYLAASPGGHILFRNPLLHRCKSAKPLPFSEVEAIEVRAGELLLFPGWLEHFTDENPGPRDKLVLSFNLVHVRDSAGLLHVVRSASEEPGS